MKFENHFQISTAGGTIPGSCPIVMSVNRLAVRNQLSCHYRL
jgi:hypothetical protein